MSQSKGKKVGSAVIIILIAFCLFFGSSYGLSYGMKFMMVHGWVKLEAETALNIVQLLRFIIIIPLMYLLYRRVKRGAVAGKASMSIIGYLLLMLIASYIVRVSISDLASGLGYYDVQPMEAVGLQVDWVNLFLFVPILAPILEELCFRGVLYGSLRKISNRWVSLVISSLLFGAMHFGYESIVYMLSTAGIGLCLGLIYEKYGKIWPCIVLHGASNLVSCLVIAFSDTDLKSQPSSGGASVETLLFGVFWLFMFVLIVRKFLRTMEAAGE